MGAEIVLIAVGVGLLAEMILTIIVTILDPDQEYDRYGY